MLHPVDLVIIAVYLIVTVIVGIASRGKQDNESDYFTAQGGFSQWLGMICVGLSIGATFFSGISMFAFPSITYSTGAPIFLVLPILFLTALVVHFWFLPLFFRRLPHEPYQIIEDKFGYPTRAISAAMYLMLRITWMGVLIYAPVVALIAGANLSDGWFWPLVLMIGISSTIYTVLGGIRGVIVTDAIQFVVMFGGIMCPIIYVLWNMPVGYTEAYEFLQKSEKLNLFIWDFSFTEKMTVWALLAGYLVANSAMYMADQMSLQRYLTAGTLPAARRAYAFNIIGVMLVIFMLMCLGMALQVWYGMSDQWTAPANADHVFPVFVVTQLPVGIIGLIFAAVLAATMSSMTSGINSLAGTITLDFVARYPQIVPVHRRLVFARMTSLVIGIGATLIGGAVKFLGTSIFDTALATAGVFAGPLLCCLLFSVSRLNVSAWSMIAGMILGCISGWLVIGTTANSLWVAPAAALVSFLFPLVVVGVEALAGTKGLFVQPAAEPEPDPT